MTVIVNDPIDLEKLENGHLKLRPMITDVASIIHEAVNHYAEQASDNNIIINTDIQPNLPAVFIDGDRVAQIIQTLLSNAINSTRDGEIRIAADYATGMETGFLSLL